MKNFYLSWKFCTLTITVFGKECLRNVLNTSRRRVNKNSLTWWYVLKTSWRRMAKTNVLVLTKTPWRHNAKASIFVLIKMFSEDRDVRHLQEVFKTSSSRQMFVGLWVQALEKGEKEQVVGVLYPNIYRILKVNFH